MELKERFAVMRKSIIVFAIVLFAVINFSFTCFGQSQGDVWERNPEYEVLEDGRIFIGGGVSTFTPEEREEYDRQWEESQSGVGSSYDVLAEYYTDYEIQVAGFEKVGAITWKKSLAEHVDRYIWVENNMVISTGIVFHDIDPNLTHDDIADYLEYEVDKGYIERAVKCFGGQSSGICQSLMETLGNLFTYPTTVFDTGYSDVRCYLTKTTVFSSTNQSQFFYICALSQQ